MSGDEAVGGGQHLGQEVGKVTDESLGTQGFSVISFYSFIPSALCLSFPSSFPKMGETGTC